MPPRATSAKAAAAAQAAQAAGGAGALSAAQLAKFETLDDSEAARLAALLPAYTHTFRAARFEGHDRADRASCSRVLQRLHLYPQLQQARGDSVAARVLLVSSRASAALRARAALTPRSHPPHPRSRARQAVEELVAASRQRTLLNLLVRLEHYERAGAARGEAPPGADSWARRCARTTRRRWWRCSSWTAPRRRTRSRSCWTSCAATGTPRVPARVPKPRQPGAA
jgi:hypothetical protein